MDPHTRKQNPSLRCGEPSNGTGGTSCLGIPMHHHLPWKFEFSSKSRVRRPNYVISAVLSTAKQCMRIVE